MGGWLALFLQQLGADLAGYSLNPPTNPSLFEVAQVSDHMHSIIGDVRDRELLMDSVSKFRPEIAFHLAAQPLVLASYEAPVETFETNVMGLINFLEAVQLSESVKAVIVVTSDKCYENRGLSRGYREDDPMGGHDPYSCSKGCAELVAASYRRSFLQKKGQALATVRAGNIIGGGDWAHHRLLPDLVRAFSRGESLFIRDPQAIRPWQHVFDPIRGYLTLARRLFEGETDLAKGWNFGPAEDSMVPVQEVVALATRLWGDGAKWEVCNNRGPHEAKILKLDCGQAWLELGWSPALNLAQALELTIDWYRAFYNGQTELRRLSLEQLGAHMAEAEGIARSRREWGAR
jgi:CDP-glucose 4,6-dehydratase